MTVVEMRRPEESSSGRHVAIRGRKSEAEIIRSAFLPA
jgi:hypothetical protein